MTDFFSASQKGNLGLIPLEVHSYRSNISTFLAGTTSADSEVRAHWFFILISLKTFFLIISLDMTAQLYCWVLGQTAQKFEGRVVEDRPYRGQL